MNVIKNVDIAVNANVYNDGKVTSRTFWTKEGMKKTIGILLPGRYSFSTDGEEKIEITSGFIEVKIHPSCSWVRYGEGEFYVLPASTSFELQCKEIVEYVCSYSNN